MQCIVVMNYFRKKDESQDSDFKDAATVCLPLINAAIRDIEKGIFPKSCLLNVEVPASALANKVCHFKYFTQDFVYFHLDHEIHLMKCFGKLQNCVIGIWFFHMIMWFSSFVYY